MQFHGKFLGNTTTVAVSNPQGNTLFNGSGTAISPQLLEGMSDDLGNVPAGFVNNFVYGQLSLANNTYLELVDQRTTQRVVGRMPFMRSRSLFPPDAR